MSKCGYRMTRCMRARQVAGPVIKKKRRSPETRASATIRVPSLLVVSRRHQPTNGSRFSYHIHNAMSGIGRPPFRWPPRQLCPPFYPFVSLSSSDGRTDGQSIDTAFQAGRLLVRWPLNISRMATKTFNLRLFES